MEDLRKKFSLDANISRVMQETKNFHQGPPSTLVLLYCKFLIENQLTRESGSFVTDSSVTIFSPVCLLIAQGAISGTIGIP